MRRIVILFILMLLPSFIFAAGPVFLSGLNIEPSASSTRFTFYLTEKTVGRIKSFSNPDRIEIEFENTFQNFNFFAKRLPGSNVKSITIGNSYEGTLRFILLITHNVQWKTNYLPANELGGERLQVEIISTNPIDTQLKKSFQEGVLKTFTAISAELKNRQLIEATNEPVKIVPEKAEANKIPVIASKKPQALTISWLANLDWLKGKKVVKQKQRLMTIVIDAGHGGKDSGALGANGKKEKDVVLAIAKKLAEEINAQPNRRAILTRKGDYFVPLRARLNIARKYKADVFVAIHADAHYDSKAMGASVFVLSPRGASSEAARWFAERENTSELGNVPLNTLDRDPILRKVMVDLAQTATIQDSVYLGNRVIDALDDISAMHNTRLERAPFVVLKSPDVPSILVETGFITNPREEARLASPSYQNMLARALRLGVDQYLHKYARTKLALNYCPKAYA